MSTSISPAEEQSPRLTGPRRIAVIGNPNTGKTTIFNALTGHRARVGNYAGVTVEKREGPLRNSDRSVSLIDLPGTYSLSAKSMDEMVAVELLLGHLEKEPRPDAVVVIADASNLERNLYLATQTLELGLPTIIALNMMDLAEKEGMTVDVEGLSKALGVPIVTLVAREQKGIDELVAMLRDTNELSVPPSPDVYTPEFMEVREALRQKLIDAGVRSDLLEPFLVARPLLEADGMIERLMIQSGGEPASKAIAEARDALTEMGLRLRSFEATSRYRWIREKCGPCIQIDESSTHEVQGFTDRVDSILTHKIYGTVIFAVLMAVVFQAIYSWSAPLMDLIDGFFGSLGGAVASVTPQGALQSFLVDGVIAGVGGVLVFLPQICVLFLFIALLEDIGYMARAAFLMDRLLSRVGLSGRSFIPMLSGFACAIPAIMAARTIENSRDRMTTILVVPLMSCSARLPVYTIFIAAFVPSQSVLGVLNLQGLVLLAMYLVGVLAAIPVAWLLKSTLLKSKTPSFLIELPPYRRPVIFNVIYRMYERASEFVIRAGTIILAVSVVIWALTYYPNDLDLDAVREAKVAEVNAVYMPKAVAMDVAVEEPASAEDIDPSAFGEDAQDLALAWQEELASVDRFVEGEDLRNSYLGRMGKLVEPAVKPLGWDWRIGMATIASFPAREVIVATLGVIFDLGGETDETSESLIQKMRNATWPDGRPLITLPVALSIMVFFALCMQCAATLAIMKKETNSWRWPVFSFVYMTALAYVAALIVYQAGTLLL